jgi:hypothetical protein
MKKHGIFDYLRLAIDFMMVLVFVMAEIMMLLHYQMFDDIYSLYAGIILLFIFLLDWNRKRAD